VSALATALAIACAHAPREEGALAWHYEVSPAPTLDRLDVKLCFRDRVPARLVADDEAAASYLMHARELAGGRALTVDVEGGQVLVGATAGKCVAYAVDLARLAEEVAERPTVRVGGVVASSPHFWLWRPAKLYREAEVTLSFVLPEGVRASVPWSQPGGEGTPHRLSTTAFTWASQVVLGRFDEDRFTAAGAEFRVAVMDLPRAISGPGLRRWIGTAAETVGGLYGGAFPVPHMQVLVVPYRGAGDPVYFGMALRGGGPAVMLLISSAATDDAFPGEWVAIHEFLHHGMPFVDHDDAWLSEGFVTYYTELLRTRAGFRAEPAAWRALQAGFERGRQSGVGMPLADESRGMHDNAAYQRVYWGGAAIALQADVALREAGSSLDAAMRELRRCCAATPRIWPAEQVLVTLDGWLDRSLSSTEQAPDPAPASRLGLGVLAGPILRSADFPDLTPIYRKLGVTVVNGELTLDESAPLAHLRRAIFTSTAP
jgi:hypothetical protein